MSQQRTAKSEQRTSGRGACVRCSLFAVRFATLLGAAVPLGGCLDRTVTITSTPPGAIVTLNDTEVGRTPVETAFLFYGDYDVRLRREGFEPVISHANLAPPVYEWIPIDLAAEAAPVVIRTRKAVHFDLEPTVPLDEAGEAALLGRARELRTQTSRP